jgi:hypothetical protein
VDRKLSIPSLRQLLISKLSKSQVEPFLTTECLWKLETVPRSRLVENL